MTKFVIVTEGTDRLIDQQMPGFLSDHHLPATMHGREMLLAVQGGKIIGCIGRVPMALRDGLRIVRGHWIVNGAVHAEYQGQGVGKALYREVYAAGDDLGGVISAKFDPQPRHLATHWTCESLFTAMRRYIYPLSIDKIHAPYDVYIDPPPSLYETWSRVQSRYGLTTERDTTWIERRYLSHPSHPYLFLCAADGIAIVRRDGPALRIVDLYGTPNGVSAVRASVLAYATQLKVDFVDFYASHSPDDWTGWQTPHWTNPDQPPPVFNPPDCTPREMVVGLWTKLGGIALRPPYITRGEAGADRP